ncbi:MAG: VOC family protein [Actinobacteria bacterium]|nr:VOC family protein [Actinomycetota bacterium]
MKRVGDGFEARARDLTARHLKPPHERATTSARGIHHLALICSDPDRTIRFYQDVLGWPLVEVMENRDFPGSAHFFFDLGHGNLLAFFDFPGLDVPDWVETLGSMQHVAISVTPEAFERIRSRLQAEGVDFFGATPEIPTSIYFRGPDGEQIEALCEPLMEMGGLPLGGK